VRSSEREREREREREERSSSRRNTATAKERQRRRRTFKSARVHEQAVVKVEVRELGKHCAVYRRTTVVDVVEPERRILHLWNVGDVQLLEIPAVVSHCDERLLRE
jgi:hypothetical protein